MCAMSVLRMQSIMACGNLKKPDVEFEEYEFNRNQTECKILIGLTENQQQIQEIWHFHQGWKIQELRFLKASKTVHSAG